MITTFVTHDYDSVYCTAFSVFITIDSSLQDLQYRAAITTGIVVAAYKYLDGLPRIILLIIGSLPLFSLDIESVKKVNY
jgi:hypothetical protein